MKLKTTILLVALLCGATLFAQNPKWYKKARKSQLTVITYDAQDNMREGQGYFIDQQGTVVTEYDMMKGAVRATVVDTEGNQYEVTHILGASSLYNVAKLETNAKKTQPSELCSTSLQPNQPVYIMPLCNTDKKAVCLTDTITSIQEFGEEKYPYYTLSKALENRYAGCPVYSEDGLLIGHVQLPASNSDKPAYAIGTSYAKSLSIKPFDANNNDLNAIAIAKALPDDESQANSYLFLMNKQDVSTYQNQVKEFISRYPNSSTGYIQLAESQAANKEYKAAEETYATAFSTAKEETDAIHHSFAKLLYQAGLLDSAPSEGWTMQHALEEANAAYAINPLPLYTALQGMCLYALKEYDKSCEKFLAMGQTNMRSAEYFLYAAQCKQMLEASNEEILALQDSSVNCFTKPYPTTAASYLYLRAKTLTTMGKHREAVADMNEYEHLASGDVTAAFCYEREQMEMQCRMFPNALSDIERAVRLSPNDPLYRAEEAVVNYRVGQLDEALAAAKEAIRLDNEFPDAHRILGICLRDKGKIAEAKQSLQRAIELGDTVAQSILDKLK